MEEPKEDAKASGGFGGQCARVYRSLQPGRLMRRALRERWDVPRTKRPGIIDRLVAIALDPNTEPREAVSAARALMGASRLNLDGLAAFMHAEEHEQLRARVEELETRLADYTREAET